jgi:hypothetical protein
MYKSNALVILLHIKQKYAVQLQRRPIRKFLQSRMSRKLGQSFTAKYDVYVINISNYFGDCFCNLLN